MQNELDASGSRLGLFTDLYELKMLESYVRLGMCESATFSLIVRPSAQRPWLVAAGLDLALDVLDRFAYGPAELEYAKQLGLSSRALEWLRSFRASGELWAVAPGTVVLGGSPLLELTAPLPVGQLLETALLNAIHYDTLIATKAARCALAARERPVFDFGFRRAPGLDTGVRAALAAHIGGVSASSNVEAGRRFGIPLAGTMAHSFVQAFRDEEDAFDQFLVDHPDGSTLLVDTYDTARGVDRAIRVIRRRQALLRPVWRDGARLWHFHLASARARAQRELSQLPGPWQRPWQPTPGVAVRVGAELLALAAETARRLGGDPHVDGR
jgi:nicotinate phosphoribosyltransferase